MNKAKLFSGSNKAANRLLGIDSNSSSAQPSRCPEAIEITDAVEDLHDQTVGIFNQVREARATAPGEVKEFSPDSLLTFMGPYERRGHQSEIVGLVVVKDAAVTVKMGIGIPDYTTEKYSVPPFNFVYHKDLGYLGLHWLYSESTDQHNVQAMTGMTDSPLPHDFQSAKKTLGSISECIADIRDAALEYDIPYVASRTNPNDATHQLARLCGMWVGDDVDFDQ